MNDTIALVGCLAVLAIAVCALQWGWSKPKKQGFKMYGEGGEVRIDIYKVYTLCLEMIKFPRALFCGVRWKPIESNGVVVYEVDCKFRTQNDVIVVSYRGK